MPLKTYQTYIDYIDENKISTRPVETICPQGRGE